MAKWRVSEVVCSAGGFGDVLVDISGHSEPGFAIRICPQVLNEAACDLPNFERVGHSVVVKRLLVGRTCGNFARRVDLRYFGKPPEVRRVEQPIKVSLKFGSNISSTDISGTDGRDR